MRKLPNHNSLVPSESSCNPSFEIQRNIRFSLNTESNMIEDIGTYYVTGDQYLSHNVPHNIIQS